MNDTPAAENLLGQESSPYLLQHANNPVHWRPWGPDALAEARVENKPILLSVGYSACHWCHVMAHESFEDRHTAELMNQLYINIKVDREERPDLDTIYQRALALMGQQGGWPLTMFLNAEGEPFWGGTYFPNTPRFGRPGFKDVLKLVHNAYHGEPDKIDKNRAAMLEALQKMAENKRGDAITAEHVAKAAEVLLREVDPQNGGIGGAPKFPQCGMLELVWRQYRRRNAGMMKSAVSLTLERMSEGGIYDHLGGGYARYSTDERWLVPHFEKMLYDNAQILELLCHLWQDTKGALYQQRAEETAAWAIHEMMTDEGAFASALDADSEGEEGKFYVWDEGEIDAVLGKDAEYFKAIYDVTAEGNWEGNSILNRLRRPRTDEPVDEARLAPLRNRLLTMREQRLRPGWDDKVLTDWNGLMIAALAFASAVFDRRDWLDAATRAWKHITESMAEGDRLFHASRHGQVKRVAFLDDYAEMSRAALVLSEVTGDKTYIDHAARWIATLDTHFWDEVNGGYFFSPDDGETLISRTKTAHDAATPAGNGTLVGVLAKLYHLTGEKAYLRRAEALVQAFSGELENNFAPIATLMNNSELLREAMQVVVIGTRGEAETDALLRTVFDISLPNRVLSVIAPGDSLPPNHPAAGKGQTDGKATAYVCVGQICSLPVTKSDALRETVQATVEHGGAIGDAEAS